MSEQRLFEALLRQHFHTFLNKVFVTLNPGAMFFDNWHLHALCWHLEEVRAGRIRRLIVEVPPRSLKSIAASVAFPAFLLGHDPTCRILSASYSNDLAAKLAADCRAIMMERWYRALFPDTRISPFKNQEANYETTRHGFRYATSIGGTLTGRGGDILIIDDPLKPEDAMSEARRDAANGWYSRTALSRLNNKVTGAIILIQQRLHLDDLAGHVRTLDDWTILSLPAIAEQEERIPIGPGRFHLRRPGDVLHPAREPRDVLDRLRHALGSATFSAQYQQCPIPAGGEIVKWDWFGRHDRLPVDRPLVIHQSWDTASKPEEHCDYSVCTTWAVDRDQLYLVDVHRARYDFPGLKRAVIAQARLYRAQHLIIEDKGTGMALIQQLRAERPQGVPSPIAYAPKDDKRTRLHAQSARIEAGHVSLPCAAPWLDTFRTELAAFPQGRHDDQVDSLSQFMSWHFERMGSRVRARQMVI